MRRGVLAMAGLRRVRWRAERATKQREKHGSDDVMVRFNLSLSSLYLQTQNVRSASPWAGPSQSISVCPCPFSTVLLLDFLARWLEKEIARPDTVYKYVPLHSASSESALAYLWAFWRQSSLRSPRSPQPPTAHACVPIGVYCVLTPGKPDRTWPWEKTWALRVWSS